MQSEFSLAPELIYLNHAGVAPWPRRTTEAVKAFAEENARWGAWQYSRWIEIESELRERLRALINAPSATDIALLKNTSEALSMVAYGLAWKAGDNLIITNQEFPSNRIVWESLRSLGVEVRVADLDSVEIPETAIIALADEHTRLISISSVQYASGLRMDLHTVGEFCGAENILFCVDAIQSLGAIPFDVQTLNADFVMADGHKWMLGPEGLALFYCRPDLREQLRLTQYGWHMVEDSGNYDKLDWAPAHSARRFECGSPNMLGIHGLNASLSLLQELGMETVAATVLDNAQYLIQGIRANPDLELLTPQDPRRHAGIVTFRHRHADSRTLWRDLLERQVICACRGGGIRFSGHFYNTPQELDRALEWAIRLAGS